MKAITIWFDYLLPSVYIKEVDIIKLCEYLKVVFGYGNLHEAYIQNLHPKPINRRQV